MRTFRTMRIGLALAMVAAVMEPQAARATPVQAITAVATQDQPLIAIAAPDTGLTIDARALSAAVRTDTMPGHSLARGPALSPIEHAPVSRRRRQPGENPSTVTAFASASICDSTTATCRGSPRNGRYQPIKAPLAAS